MIGLWLIPAKFILTIAVVLGVPRVAERVDPRIAGFLAALPTGLPLLLLFIGIDHGPHYAAGSAVYTLVGLIAGLAQFFVYYQASNRFKQHPVLLSAAASLAAYFVVALALSFVPFTGITAALALLAAIIVSLHLYKGLPADPIEEKAPLTEAVLVLCAGMAGLLVVALTGVAGFVGPAWAGLLSAISVTTFPLLLILHHAYGPKPVHTVIKSFPIGVTGLLVYSLTAHYVFAAKGVFIGTAAAYAATAVYLAAYLVAKKKWAWLP